MTKRKFVEYASPRIWAAIRAESRTSDGIAEIAAIRAAELWDALAKVAAPDQQRGLANKAERAALRSAIK